MTPVKSSWSRRLQMLGTASLPALLIGGLILILVGANALSNPTSTRNPSASGEFGKSRVSGQLAFKIGGEWSVQSWIAVTGVAFGLLSFGFAETYMHIFDAWCSRQAHCVIGLDYARYLNSQARAPVRYGLRGFPVFITLRYIITAMCIAASIGYKFAIVTPEVRVSENLGADVVNYLPHRTSMITNDSSFANPEPWISDIPLHNDSRAFSHAYPSIPSYNNDALEHANTTVPPVSIIMVGHASCMHNETLNPYFSQTDIGIVFTRELALIAKHSEVKGTFIMTEDKGDWQRIEASNSGIFSPPQNAIIEYRVPKFAELEIQWAKAPNGSSNTWEVPVVQRSRYTINAGMAQVRRRLETQDCKNLIGFGGSGVTLRAVNNGTLGDFLQRRGIVMSKDEIGRDRFNITKKIPGYSVWLEPLVKTQDTTPLASISAIVRAVMTAYRMDMWGTPIIEEDDMPFGEETDHVSETYPGLKSPFYVGTRVDRYSGCYSSAAVVFIVFGCFAILVGIFRVWLGPPVLTSWMGQHVYLARTEAISLSEKASSLASGYQVAKPDLGRLRLSTQKGEEAGAMLEHDNGTDSEGQSTKGRGDTGLAQTTQDDVLPPPPRQRL
ncbi:hypothetical protein FAUST_3442 [Fusarium austroamericanum]|uniref:Uncharacterized protein n=1 Tax=Fusarium austroamericanum TaxID=282268 RepID=A0AAN6HHS7_FUSAU|nr:hypothetical protein FAUST_3442 [Fusarium austroamericanum]